MKRKGIILAALFFTLILVNGIYAQSQSFYIPGGSSVSNTGGHGVVRGFCLEANKDIIGIDNINDLINYTGSVTVNYLHKSAEIASLSSLLQKINNVSAIELKGLGSYGHIGIVFNDKNITKITFNNEGALLYRTDNDRNLLENKGRIIQGWLYDGMSHYQAQYEGWRTLEGKREFVGNILDYLQSVNKLGMTYTTGGIENLLETSVQNEREYMRIKEKQDELFYQYYETQSEMEHFLQTQNNDQEQVTEMGKFLLESLLGYTVNQEMIRLSTELFNNPFLRSNIVKWPHHAHAFNSTDPERIRSVIKMMEDTIKPDYYIYEKHQSQGDFEQLLDSLKLLPKLRAKFVSSDELEKIIYSKLNSSSHWAAS